MKNLNKYRKQFGKNSIKIKMVYAYSFVIVIAVTFIGVFSELNISKVLNEKVYMAEKNSLRQVLSDIDHTIEKANTLALNMSKDPQLQNDFSELSAADMFDISRDFFQKYYTDNAVQSMYIYYTGSGKILSTRQGVTDITFMDDLSWIDEYNKNAPLSFKMLELYRNVTINNTEENVLSIVRGISGWNGQEIGAAVINLDISKVIPQNLKENTANGALYIINGNNDVVYGDNVFINELRAKYKYDTLLQSSGKFKNVSLNSGMYTLIIEKSNLNKLTCIRKYETDYLDTESRNIQYMTILIICLCILGGIILSNFIANKMYEPLINILNKTNIKTKENKASNELELLDIIFNDMMDEQYSVEKFYKESQRFIIHNVLLKLCYGTLSQKDELDVLEKIEEYKYLIKRKNFMAIVIEVNGSESTKSIDRDIFNDIWSGEYVLMVTALSDNKVVGLIGFDSEETNVIEIAENIRLVLKGKCGIDSKIGLGNAYDSINKFQLSFREALDALLYKNLKNNETIFHINRFVLNNELPKYYYPVDKENELAEQIKLGNKAEAISIFEDMYNEILMLGLDIDCFSKMFWQIMGSIVRVIMSMGINYDSISGQSYYDDFMKFNSMRNMSEMHDFVLNKINDLVDYVNKKRDYSNQAVVENIKKYILQNYNKELSLDIFSEMTNLTPVYISSIFRKTEGKGLRDYIICVRMKKAEELILKTNKSIESIANEIGYENLRSFQRVFKSYFGVSPSVYRKANAKKTM